jgi:hypothetical protein
VPSPEGEARMDWQPFQDWLSRTNLVLIGVILFAAMCAAAAVGILVHGRQQKKTESEGGQEGYIVSAVLGLLALLMGFTFSLAVDRFDARRQLVLEEANAIGTAYLRAQLLSEPHRSRMSTLLVRYTDNRIALAKATPGQTKALLAVNDALLTDIWAATSAAFETIKGLDFSSTYLDSVNALIDLDASRKTARLARVPAEVFAVLFVYLVVTAGVLGYVLKGVRGRLAAAFLLALLTLSLLLILDIDRPVLGGIGESQRPMEELRKTLGSQPPSVFDKWKTGTAE